MHCSWCCWQGKRRPPAPPKATLSGDFTVSVSATELRGSGSVLGVSVSSPTPNDGSHWLGMFLQGSNYTAIGERFRNFCPPGGCAQTTPPWTATAPLKYWTLNNAKLQSSFSVHVVNYRKPVVFSVFASAIEPRLVTSSPPVSFARMRCEPTGVHLARSRVPGQLRVTWQSGERDASLRWRRRAPEQGASWETVPATSSTYRAAQMCGLPANMSIGWHDPGWIHTAVFGTAGESSPAKPAGDGARESFQYAVGTSNCTTDTEGALWSPAYVVRAPPTPTEQLAVLFIGDMGEAPRDSPISEHHWQMPQPTEVVDAMIASNSDAQYDAVWHIGDLSYATGYGSVWDGFMRQIEPLATVLPYYTSPGNHERDSPGTGAFQHGDDSGGECGVPFNARFIQPGGDSQSAAPPPNSTDSVPPFYSDSIGPVHVIFASTEHDYHAGSAQHAWLQRDLAAVNRSATPFLVFSGHRPMYGSTTVGENAPGKWHVAPNSSFNWQMAEALEPLFAQHHVDLALWGHVHNYERTCPLLNQTCRPAGQGTVHVTAGTAGASTTVFPSFNRSSGTWTSRKCVANTSLYGPGCHSCADVTSCSGPQGGFVPCIDMRCAPPPAWSVARSEEHGYVRLSAPAAGASALGGPSTRQAFRHSHRHA